MTPSGSELFGAKLTKTPVADICRDRSSLNGALFSNGSRPAVVTSSKVGLGERIIGRRWLYADVIIHVTLSLLLATRISLRRLHRYVAKQKLNLLNLPAARVAETRAGPATAWR